jgi:2-oxo-4-hydroxy-4-carboxy-5-ureidoimidazoline decarboxylase
MHRPSRQNALPMPYTLEHLNAMSQEEFTDTLGDIFEHTPNIARQAWYQRPFDDWQALHGAMVTIVLAMPRDQQRALIQAHPDLGTRATMAAASVQEQTQAGLQQLTPDEYERFQQLNQAYKTRFGFPFIVAVKHQTKATILQAFEQRLTHDLEQEHQTAIAEINKIAAARLANLALPSATPQS